MREKNRSNWIKIKNRRFDVTLLKEYTCLSYQDDSKFEIILSYKGTASPETLVFNKESGQEFKAVVAALDSHIQLQDLNTKSSYY